MSAGGVTQRVGGGCWSRGEVVQEFPVPLPPGEQLLGHEEALPHHLMRYWDPTGVLGSTLWEGPVILLLSGSSLGQVSVPSPVSQSCSWCARPSALY